MRLLPAFVSLWAAAFTAGAGMKSPIKADETVTFFTTAAWPAPDGADCWLAEVHGIVFESGQAPLRSALLGRLLKLDRETLSEEERAIRRGRLNLFTIDCERGKQIAIRLGGKVFELPRSGADGHFRTTLRLPAAMVEGRRELPFSAVLREGDGRLFTGKILLQPDASPRPLIISDIDDTIKISQVRDRSQVVLNTFCRPFRAVEGMAGIYRQWESAHGAQFHYVSGSPWQLYGALEEFTAAAGFPEGAWHLKPLRLKDPSTLRTFAGSQHEYKTAGIGALLERWPRRPVVLVGDTGEQDPEIFSGLARRFPDRIHRILLRNSTGETRGTVRLADAFRNVPDGKWVLFNDAAELRGHRPVP